MAVVNRSCRSLTGGAADSVDSIASSVLTDTDLTLVLDSEQVYFYELDSTSGVDEDSPRVIKPDDELADKRHLLTGAIFGNDVEIVADDKKVIIGLGSDAEIYVNSDNLIIKNVTQDKDIIFYANDGGVDTEMMRIDGSDNKITGNFDIAGIQDASETQKGIVELATIQETWERTSNTLAVHPAGLETKLPAADDGSIDDGGVSFIKLQALMYESIKAGTTFSKDILSTYSLVYTVGVAYIGGVLAPNGDIHFVPLSATVGQKINSSGVISTYSLVYTISSAYVGGVLAPNGDIHFVPYSATVGQKINSSGVISTYSLAYTTSDAYSGGVLAPNGDIHFVPRNATVGQKISTLPSKPFSLAMCCHSYFNKF